MRISRRDALKLAGVGALITTVPGAALSRGRVLLGDGSLYPPDISTPWPILQGPTDAHSTSLVLLLPRTLDFSVDVRDEAGSRRPMRVASRFDMPEIGLATTEIVVTGLSPGRDYILTVLNADGARIDRRVFGSLDLTRRDYRLGLASCMLDTFRRRAITMWEAMAREQCDLVVLLGDTCYADRENPERSEAGYSRRYAETRLAISWFRMERLVPTFATWDDHDFGINNGDRSFALAPFTRRLFRAFWGSSDNSAWQKAFGVGSRLEAFGHRFYLLDDRSFRDPPGTPEGTHWGREQTDWLLDDLARSHRPAWLMNGSQFFGGRRFEESVEDDHPANFARLTNRLSEIQRPVVFASGDVHYSEIRRIPAKRLGLETFEFTSSSMHSTSNPLPRRFGDPDQLDAERRHNFMVLDVDGRDGFSVRSRSVLEGNKVAFDRTVRIGGLAGSTI